MLRNEHNLDYRFDSREMKERLCFFRDRKCVTIDDKAQTVVLNNNEVAESYISFFTQITGPIIDAYLVVMLTLEELCGKQIVIKKHKLVKELHSAIKNLFTDGVIPQLHSCLSDILKTAWYRFEQMGLLLS